MGDQVEHCVGMLCEFGATSEVILHGDRLATLPATALLIEERIRRTTAQVGRRRRTIVAGHGASPDASLTRSDLPGGFLQGQF
jgi:hypothetical protein